MKSKNIKPDPDDVSTLCIERDFTPQAIKKFYEETFPRAPDWAVPKFERSGYNPPKKPPIFESKEEMNPYLRDVFMLVDEDEMSIRDDMFSQAGIKYGMLMTVARRRYVYKYAWAIPCKAALEAITKEGPIVEVGAGSGYWAHLLSQMGCDIIAYDIEKENRYALSGPTNFHHRWFEVIQGDEKSAARHPDRALFLCWPPYGETMAYKCLKSYKGDTVIFVGEDKGGCNGDDKFFDHLEEHFHEVESIEIPVWLGLHDRLYIFKRNKK